MVQGIDGVTSNSDEETVLRYVRAAIPFLQKVPDDAFEGIDGAVFFGLTPETVELCFPNVGPRERGLLLARIQTLRNEEFGSRTPSNASARTPRSALASNVGSNVESSRSHFSRCDSNRSINGPS